MTDETTMTNLQTAPALDPDERPATSGKRWAILVGFAAVALIAAASVNHRGDKQDQPPAAAAANAPAPASSNAVLPQGAAPTKSGG